MPDWLRAGIVGRPHGLDGSFHVLQASAPLLEVGMAVQLQGDLRTIARRSGTEQHVILRLEGCEDRDAAQALRGSELLVGREQAPELEADEWWAEDLEGCVVCDGAREIGIVSRLLALPSCEVLEVARAGEGTPEPPLLVPLVADAVRAVDVKQRRIDVDLRFLGEE